ncbi:Peptidase M1, membrane alanine aminopeptidase, N-terminal [Cinara cedri]|uniref:glutamyl aminopeptidase n=1 Tax=Cinara cedri TaxID=506608 RepID=A0A5E4N1S7_9HEMI|nr:Peptidase M1, membrane alanine aminopeptidase, N-terminal [Cinara cedri]
MSTIKRTVALVLTAMSIIVEAEQDENVLGNPKMPFNKTAIMEMEPWECTIRLSKHVRPIQYVLYISSNSETDSFTGSVEITIILDSPQSFIKLHSSELKITETTLDSNPITAFCYSKYQFWVVVPDEELSVGIHTLRMKFDGCLSNTMFGFYRSDYFDEGTYKQHTIVTTQFEPTFARSTFPCFDEPEMKSKFQISITRPSGNNFIALSNMDQECEEPVSPANGLTIARFANTLPMSTYLVCFIVCDFQASEIFKADQGFLIRTFVRRDQQKNTKYASYVALKAINYFVEYFGIKYMLPKLDIIAIPDFEAGAMENWGLITFRETQLLYDECTSSSTSKSSVASTVCHELAHMWFGDLGRQILN